MENMENNVKTAPEAGQIRTDRGLLKFVLLTIVTFGIYGIIFMAGIGRDVNRIASEHDGKRTMSFYLVAFVFSWLTLGIVPLVWYHRMSNRIGEELRRREKTTLFGANTFWLWNVVGSFIVVGPFIYCHRLINAMNELAEDYNARG